MADEPKKHKRRMTEKQLANLRPAKKWEKGQSGNPAGKPPGIKDRATILRELLKLNLKKKTGDGKFQDVEHPLDPRQKSITVEEAVNAALIKKALSGSEKATELILDSVYGKIVDKKSFENPDGSPLSNEWSVSIVDARTRDD